MSSPISNTARTSTSRRSESSHPSSSAVRRSYPSSRLNRGRASALATEPELGSTADEFLDAVKESRAGGLMYVRDEPSRRAQASSPMFAASSMPTRKDVERVRMEQSE